MNKLATMIPLLIGERTIGRTVLNKLVFFADLIHFLRSGSTISGVPLLKLAHGPVPKQMFETRRDLKRAGLLAETEHNKKLYKEFSYSVPPGTDLNALRESLTADELEAIDVVREQLAGKTANFLSTASHRFEPWKSAITNCELDMSLAKEDSALRQWLVTHKLLH